MSEKVRGDGGQIKIFFFQAEEGIRDIGVTGVQTCALPISADFNGSSSFFNPSPTLGAELVLLQDSSSAGNSNNLHLASSHLTL